MTKEERIARIDLVADHQRAKIVGDPVRAFEYKAAEEEALSFKSANYTGVVPPTVSAWANARNWTAQQATDDILNEAARFRQALNYIRTVRLAGKYGIQDAVDEIQIQEIFDRTINQLKALG